MIQNDNTNFHLGQY